MRYYRSSGTDCLRCCVANLFNCRLEDVPNWGDIPDETWFSIFSNWMIEHHHIQPIILPEYEQVRENLHYFQVGKLEGGTRHVAIGVNDAIVNDPDPLERGWLEKHFKILFVPRVYRYD